MRGMYVWLADGVLVLHGLVVLFNIGALPLIWVGYLRKWSLVRNPYFRVGHLLLLGYVVAETALGANCPLTSLEDTLRLKAGGGTVYSEGFIAHWLQPLIFWDMEPWVFVLVYALFFAFVVFTFFRIRPRAPGWWVRQGLEP
jgi:hypothetical protein